MSTNLRAAARAAPSREGGASVAAIEPETSSTRTTVASCRCGREPLAQTAIAGVHPKLATRLRIDKTELTDIGELLLARIAYLDGEHRVAARETHERRAPVDAAAEVRDDHDERTLARDTVGRASCR